jgi:hypothetical protein
MWRFTFTPSTSSGVATSRSSRVSAFAAAIYTLGNAEPVAGVVRAS